MIRDGAPAMTVGELLEELRGYAADHLVVCFETEDGAVLGNIIRTSREGGAVVVLLESEPAAYLPMQRVRFAGGTHGREH